MLELLRGLGRHLLAIPRTRAWIPLLLWMGLIHLLSSSSSLPRGVPRGWGVVGNLGHAPLFGLLGLWALLGLPRSSGTAAAGPGPWPRLGAGSWALVLAGVTVYGAVDELHQSRVPGRDFSMLDLLTDVVGAICVLVVVGYVGRDGARERGLWLRLAAGGLACLSAALVATYLPRFFPGVNWM